VKTFDRLGQSQPAGAAGVLDKVAGLRAPTRRHLLGAAGLGGLALVARPALGGTEVDLRLPGGYGGRPIATDFPQKGPMILQRTRPPLLETPWDVFDKGVFTPNDRFYVRWHWADIPTEVDAASFRLAVRGHVNQPLSLSLDDILHGLPQVELAAVNQCSGNSRGFFEPRVAGGEWANGAMGNARWGGVRLRDVLDRAGVKAGAVEVRFTGLDEPVVSDAPRFMKSLAIDHARDGEVMIAYAMNGEQLPLLNGFPLRLVVPGWYATYWVKMLSDIEVLDGPDTNYWMAQAYMIPDTPHASVRPGETGVPMVPINRMVPRSFFTNVQAGEGLPAGTPAPVRGIALGGDAGVAAVDLSSDGGRTWSAAALGPDEGKYGFRRWQADVTLAPGRHVLMVRCTNANGVVQPMQPNWNPAGFMRNVVESVDVVAA
jgi:DMSO/TMAO reductase YedYZ molybdopterin-dependent catalytic subunit